MDESTTGSGDLLWPTTPTAEVGRITQLTETGHVMMYPKLERREWIFGTAPDPRDVRIAELEAALRDVRKLALVHDNRSLWDRLESVGHVASAALRGIPAPERDMTITVEELDA